MDRRVKDILKYILWIAVAVLLLYFCFRRVDWKNFGAALAQCRWEFVILSMLLGALTFYLRGLRWQMLLRPIDPSTSSLTCFNAMNICMVVNLLLPRVGEVVRAGYVTRHSAKGPDGKRLASIERVLGTVVVDRVWDGISLIVVLLILLSFMWDKFGEFFETNMFSGLSGKTGLLWILIGAGAIAVLFIWLCWRFKDRGRIWGSVWGIISGIGDGLKSCLHMRHSWLFVFYTVLIWVIYWFMSATVMWALQGIDPSTMAPEMAAACEKVNGLNMVDALFLMFAGALSSLVPVPGGFGAFHFVVAGALSSVYGIPFEFGLIFATLSHESQVITDAIAGIGSYIGESFRKSGN